MDKISQLLQEAKPLYIRRQNEKRTVISALCTLCLVFFIWSLQPKSISFDDERFDTYFTALYQSDFSEVENCNEDSVVPLDYYGLYEV